VGRSKAEVAAEKVVHLAMAIQLYACMFVLSCMLLILRLERRRTNSALPTCLPVGGVRPF